MGMEACGMSKKKKAGIALLIILAIILIGVGVVYFVGHRYYSKTNYVSDEEIRQQIEEQKTKQNEQEIVEEEVVTDPELLAAQRNIEKYASEEPITTDGSVYNVLLIGVDTTKDNYIGNSDSMILVSINYRLHKISMISLMRDTYVHIPNVGYRKLNAAYPNGGGPLLIETIEENFKININRYMTVDFGNMIQIIDEIGSIQITFSQKEAENANKSIKQQCKLLGLKYKDYKLPSGGTYQCNGMQAVAYARIRKVGNADYQRTERQREVLMKLLENVKKMSIDDLDRLATRLLPMLTHNIPEDEFWGLMGKVATLLSYNIEQDRIPYDGMFVSVNGNLTPDWESTVSKLKDTLYGTDAIIQEVTEDGTIISEDGTPVTIEPTQTPDGETPVTIEPTEVPDNIQPTLEGNPEDTTGLPQPNVQIDETPSYIVVYEEDVKKAAVLEDNLPEEMEKIEDPYYPFRFEIRLRSMLEREEKEEKLYKITDIWKKKSILGMFE